MKKKKLTLQTLSGIKYINKENGAFSDSAGELGGRRQKIVLHKGDPLQYIT